jgi:hypothetical protein
MTARTVALCVRLTRAELASMRREAKVRGHATPSAWARAVLLGDLLPVGVPDAPDRRQVALPFPERAPPPKVASKRKR